MLAFLNPKYLGVLELAAKRTLEKQVPDPELRAKLTPTYRIGCKRILLTNDYFPALQRPDVSLTTSGIEEFTESGIRTKDGELHEADVVILATGFSTDNRCASEHIVGRGGLTIQEAWRDGMTAHLGTTVAGFPNLFMLMGPNSGGGAQSILFVIEAQVHYIVECLEADALPSRHPSGGPCRGAAALQRLVARQAVGLRVELGGLPQLVPRPPGRQPPVLAGHRYLLLARHPPPRPPGVPADAGGADRSR